MDDSGQHGTQPGRSIDKSITDMDDMSQHEQFRQRLTRRHFFGRASIGLGMAAFASLIDRTAVGAETRLKTGVAGSSQARLPGLPHHLPTAKRVIFLFQTGGPSQIDLFDHKPLLADKYGEELPASVRGEQVLTTMTSGQVKKPIAPPLARFAKYGKCGAEVSDLMPHTARIVDDLCFVKSMQTDAINHDPALTMLMTGVQQPGRPSWGSWVSYGLGSENENLPTFAAFISGGQPGDQPLNGRLWGASFLPSQHQGVKFRSGQDPVLFLSNPDGISRQVRRNLLDGMGKLNALHQEAYGDPETEARMAQFELAYRMQSAVPELTDLRDEPEHIFQLYGEESRRPGTYAANCLLARRMVERGVRFVQLCQRGWDHHANLPSRLPKKCEQVDQGSAALIQDLKQRGLLNDTLVIWAGEFGRTVFSQGDLLKDAYGRDHHPRCFTIWLAGGGMKRGVTIGKTDDFSYNVVEDPIHVHDLQATVLHCLGIDHERLTYRHLGRDFRLTDVAGKVIRKVLA